MVTEVRKSYVKPEVVYVHLTPADAVLSACKDGSTLSPNPCGSTCQVSDYTS